MNPSLNNKELQRKIEIRKDTIQRVDILYQEATFEKNFKLDSSDPDYISQQPHFKNLRKKILNEKELPYPQKTLRKIKELASCPELIEARKAMKNNILPQPLSSGVSGSYILLGTKNQKLGIFKPGDQELGAPNNPKNLSTNDQIFGVEPGTSYLRERAAYLLDKKDHFSGVPLTKIVEIKSKYLPISAGSGTEQKKVGSFQKWAHQAHIAYKDYQVLPSWLSSAKGHLIPKNEIHKIAIFDIRFLNCDRHLENFMVSDDLKTVYPIDHGYILPGDATSLRFDWINFYQAKEPFSESTLKYIDQIDIKADKALIKKKIPNLPQNTLGMIEVSARLLKIAAKKGLNAYQIADLYMRRKHEGLLNILNQFIPVPSKTPSYFEAIIWKKAPNLSSTELDAFLKTEVDNYLSLNREIYTKTH